MKVPPRVIYLPNSLSKWEELPKNILACLSVSSTPSYEILLKAFGIYMKELARTTALPE